MSCEARKKKNKEEQQENGEPHSWLQEGQEGRRSEQIRAKIQGF